MMMAPRTLVLSLGAILIMGVASAENVAPSRVKMDLKRSDGASGRVTITAKPVGAQPVFVISGGTPIQPEYPPGGGQTIGPSPVCPPVPPHSVRVSAPPAVEDPDSVRVSAARPRVGKDPDSDLDGDGISDACEQELAEKYAPIVYHSSDESNYPTNVDLFLRQTTLRFYDDNCWPDLKKTLKKGPLNQYDLLGWWYYKGCGAKDKVYSDGTRSREKQRTFFLQDVANSYRKGSLDSRDWTTYYHAYRNTQGGVTIQYWRFYAYNDAANDHGGDWEGIDVVLDSELQAAKIGFMGHTSIDYKGSSEIEWEGNHPRIYSEGGGHASRPRGGGIKARGCGGIWCGIDANKSPTFVRQETWSGGKVRWFNGKTGVTGRLLNLGEKLAPMNGQVFIKYSGIWGSPGTFFFTSGYWGPAFNETGMGSDGFITAWCAGMDPKGRDMKRECYPSARSR